MKTLLAVLVGVLAAIGAVVLLRKKQEAWSPAVSSARDTATSWGKSAADGASQAADKAAATAESATDAASQAADKAAATADGATDAASQAADKVKSKVREGT